MIVFVPVLVDVINGATQRRSRYKSSREHPESNTLDLLNGRPTEMEQSAKCLMPTSNAEISIPGLDYFIRLYLAAHDVAVLYFQRDNIPPLWVPGIPLFQRAYNVVLSRLVACPSCGFSVTYVVTVGITPTFACVVRIRCTTCNKGKCYVLPRRFVVSTETREQYANFVRILDQLRPQADAASQTFEYEQFIYERERNSEVAVDVLDTTSRFVAECATEHIQQKTLAIRAPCGSGKSKFAVMAACKLFQLGLLPNGIFCPVVTRCQSAAHTAAFGGLYPGYQLGDAHPNDLEVQHYKSLVYTVQDVYDNKKTYFSVISTINSILSVMTYHRNGVSHIHIPSFLWIDECESVFAALTHSRLFSVSRGGRRRIVDIFEHMIKHAAYVYVTDAYLSSECMQYIEALRTDTYRIALERRFRVNNATVYSISKEGINDVILSIQMYMRDHKKVFVLCDTLKAAEKMYAALTMSTATNEMRRIRLYSSKTPDTERQNEFAQCCKTWINFDVVIATPTLTTGVDFTSAHFNACIVHVTGRSVEARTILQMIIRVRTYIDSDVLIFAEEKYSCSSLSYEHEEAATNLLAHADVSSFMHHSWYVIDDTTHAIVPRPLHALYTHYRFEKLQSRVCIISEVSRLCLVSGFNVKFAMPVLADEEGDEALKILYDAYNEDAEMVMGVEMADATTNPPESLVAIKEFLGVTVDPLPVPFIEAVSKDKCFVEGVMILSYIEGIVTSRAMADTDNTFLERNEYSRKMFVHSLLSLTSLLKAIGCWSGDGCFPLTIVMNVPENAFCGHRTLLTMCSRQIDKSYRDPCLVKNVLDIYKTQLRRIGIKLRKGLKRSANGEPVYSLTGGDIVEWYLRKWPDSVLYRDLRNLLNGLKWSHIR